MAPSPVGLLKGSLKALAAAVILLLAFIGLQSLLRDPPGASLRAFGDLEGSPSPGDPEFARTLAVMTQTVLTAGNRLDLLLNGDGTYPVLWRDMHAASRSLTVQSYYIAPGETLDSLATIMAERARAGVRTHFLYDAFGGSIPDSTLKFLAAAGVRSAAFRPIGWYTLHKAQNRSHIRAITIDGVIGYTGGFGIDDKWLGNAEREGRWRDTNVRFRGPAVSQLQGAFDRAWVETTGELLVGETYFPMRPDSAPAGGMTAGFMHSPPTFGPTNNALLFALAVTGARRSIHISNAYFVPNDALLDQLLAAAKRGVDVVLLLPGPLTDVPITRYAARSRYDRLLRGGVRVYEYVPTMMHAKTFVIDGMFASVGSANLDHRSLALNDEGNLLVHDAGFGATMDSLFAADLTRSRAITRESFARRGVWDRLREAFAGGVGKLL